MRPPRLLALPPLLLGALHLSCPRVAELPLPATLPRDLGPLAALIPPLSPPPAPIVAEPLALPVPEPQPPQPPQPQPPQPQPPAPVADAAAAAAVVDPAPLPELPPELVDDGSDALPPEAPPPPEPEVHELASVAREAWVFSEPRWGSRKLGYLRAGAIVQRRAEAAGQSGCAGGWYHVEPRGYVCAGTAATLNIHDPVVEASTRRPTLAEGLPYTYVLSRHPPPPRYARLPSLEEQLRAEPDLKGHLRKAAALERAADFVAPPPPDPTPGALLYDRPAPPLGGERRDPAALVLGHAQARSGFALLSTFDHEGRRFGLTTDLEVLPLDRARVVRESSFVGLRLEGELDLPVAFIKRRRASRLIPTEGGGLARGPALGFREAVPLTGEIRRADGAEHRVARDGSLIRAEDAVIVEPLQRPPAWAASGANGRKWIDVSILRQTLTAYEGTRPVYVTLVSTGADGLGDPKKTRSTIQGAFLIHTKHVTVTMDGDEDDEDRFDFRDVPFVQYFTEGYALHAAYWHDEFGTPRSHGCVNLSPRDAAWLFGWTTPEVPAGWHAALSLKKGTLVYIHP